MKVIINSIIPFKGYIAITLFPFIFAHKELSNITYNHECIHAEQQKELLVIFFLLLYIIEYLIKFIVTFNHKKAYKSISFEQEAYKFEKDNIYRYNRKHYNWLKYIFKLI